MTTKIYANFGASEILCRGGAILRPGARRARALVILENFNFASSNETPLKYL